ncbi:aspartate aminotransferase [Microdochium trichocladiopsis]|uniref:Aspartate aminotransferase n=1 Tax=Microdochium trichocladiopsis TaxID=1682393 RepID=A0A9P8Y518_9PEZI|nr:aspartate aminotransferase [Microdochium trichocladiopsis]KAH7029868.1 aspartate aminotransferase [Microdochium trichocladiopsis]
MPFFDQVQLAPPDNMYELKLKADPDRHPDKVDLGVGIYRNEHGAYHELQVVRQAKEHLAAENPDHDYEVTTGNADFVRLAARLVFGKDSAVLTASKTTTVQTISGTGAVHLALLFLSRSVPNMSRAVYVGVPAWGNYKPMCELVGLDFNAYNHYVPSTGLVDWESVLSAVRSAPRGSIFILQGCCHNPTAADFTQDQWVVLAREMKEHDHFPVFDVAYHGLGKGLDEDIFSVRHFASMGFEALVCQSFSKNFGLYGERVGALHAICANDKAARAVHDQLRFLIRSEFSSSPAFGARIVTRVLSDPGRETAWREEIASLQSRLQLTREKLRHLLCEVHKTPGNWDIITHGTGLFSLLPLTPEQCRVLQDTYHIYVVPTGRITIPGLNENNVSYVAKSIDEVIRASQQS